ncbi:MAG: signal peptide peptidase SppA [Pedosphaera sp.]|nr:signal peptide peptidase SppA [Pedosphaera sp.]
MVVWNGGLRSLAGFASFAGMDNNQPPLVPAQSAPANPPAKNGWMWLLVAALMLVSVCVMGGLIGLVMALAPTQMGGVDADGEESYHRVVIRKGAGEDKIAVVDVSGLISSFSFDASGRGLVTGIREQLARAGKDDDVKAVILRVDSPGGEVLASDEIYKAIRAFQGKYHKPVVASMGSVAASGGYYVSAPCRLIVANELTITGSIGVIMQGYNYRGLLDKIGVQPMVFKSGRNKDMLSSTKLPTEITPEEKKMVQDLIDETYLRFVAIVKEGRTEARKKNEKTVRALAADWQEYADGRILTGKQALQHGLVDKLGNFDTAVEETEKLVGLAEKAELIRYSVPFNFANFFRLVGEAKTSTVKVDLGVEVPKIRSGRLYFLSPFILD